MKVALIVAMDEQQGIGKNNDLMWHLPADMKFFKTTTTDQIVVMGRKNYESIPERFRPLPNRENVVLTRNANYEAPNCIVFHDLSAVIEHYQSQQEQRIVFIIGGGQIYEEALKMEYIEEMFITHVHHNYDADTFFPNFDKTNWQISTIHEQAADEKNAVSFTIKHYIRK